ncbi:olfactory receptor 51I1-like [Pelodiscus sinensis]|uniref:olfactory receptor 51I1-like n=1 Tax=Pelodiscus sinensis TaxID=13735 RepID=UPI003F6A891D
MVGFNSTSFHPATFQLTGFPGQEAAYHWIAVPFVVLYVTAMAGNCLVLCIVWADRRLHQPMYLFLCMLSVNDLGMSLSTLPTVLGTFLFHFTDIAFDACLAQMAFIHFFSHMESAILVAMAFDRLVAICNPLRYAAILTHPRIVRIGLAVVVRNFSVMFPVPFLIKRLPFCRSNALSHTYCLHPDVMKLACADISVNNIYGLFAVLFVFGVDLSLISISYVVIVTTIFNIASGRERLKALNTCVSHVCAVLIYFIPMITVSVIHRYGRNTPHVVHALMSTFYLFVPPVLNPIIYTIKTKEIRKCILKMFSR